MRHLRQAHLLGKDERGLTLDCGGGTTCRIIAVTNEVVRVLFLQGGAPREPRSWMVLGQPDGPGVIDCKTRSTPPQAPLKCARRSRARPTYFLCSCRLLTGEAAAHSCIPPAAGLQSRTERETPGSCGTLPSRPPAARRLTGHMRGGHEQCPGTAATAWTSAATQRWMWPCACLAVAWRCARLRLQWRCAHLDCLSRVPARALFKTCPHTSERALSRGKRCKVFVQ